MTEYEVQCPETWAWYTAYIRDFNEKDKKLLVTYPDDWKTAEWIAIEKVRYKFDESRLVHWRPAENEEVECKARAEEGEPYGWWACRSKKYVSNRDLNQSLYNISFSGWGAEHSEILSIDFLRPRSTAKTLSPRNMHRQEYEVPIELKAWVQQHLADDSLLSVLTPHKNVQSQIVHIDYLEQRNRLLLVGVKHTLTTLKDIVAIYFIKQMKLLQLKKETQALEDRNREQREEELKAEKVTFNIHPFLSGYLRGKHGRHIEAVYKEGQGKIINIQPQMESVYIAARDKATLRWATDQLQVVCKKVIIPEAEMGQILGNRQQQIEDIRNKADVMKIRTWKRWKEQEFELLRENQYNRYRSGLDFDKSRSDLKNGQRDTDYGGGGGAYDEDDSNIPEIIRNTTVDNIFGEHDVIDLTVGYEAPEWHRRMSSIEEEPAYDEEPACEFSTDALVIIGRKSRVELCVFMIEMTLNFFRTISKTRQKVFDLRSKINKIKGNPPPMFGGRGGRGRGRDGRRDGRGGGGGGRGGGGGGGGRNGRGRDNRERRDRYRDDRYRDDRYRDDRHRDDRPTYEEQKTSSPTEDGHGPSDNFEYGRGGGGGGRRGRGRGGGGGMRQRRGGFGGGSSARQYQRKQTSPAYKNGADADREAMPPQSQSDRDAMPPQSQSQEQSQEPSSQDASDKNKKPRKRARKKKPSEPNDDASPQGADANM